MSFSRPVLLALSTAVTLAAAEVVLRAVGLGSMGADYRAVLVRDAEFGHRFLPGASHRVVGAGGDYVTAFLTDASGFRFRARMAGPPVVLLGDSEVFGQGVADGETLDAVLEELLGIPVVNLGLPGIGTVAEEAVFRKAGLPLAPRAVVLLVTPGNDLRDNLTFGKEGGPRPLIHSSALYGFTLTRLRALALLAPGLASVTGAIPQLAEQWYSPAGVADGLALMEGAMARILASGVPMTVAVIPALPQFESAHRTAMLRLVSEDMAEAIREDPRRPQRIVGEVCSRLGIRYVELLDEFERLAQEGVELKHPNDGHLNAWGTREIARILAESIS